MATAIAKEPRPQITLLEAVAHLTEKYGTQAAASEATGVNKTYWSRLAAGIKDWPSDETLAKLGLRRNVSYEWVRQPRGKKATQG